MKFNAYIVELKHRETTLSANLLTPNGHVIPVNFLKIGKDLFTANFKTQIEFTFLEQATLKGKNKDILVLLPLLSKYNQRKLGKIAKFLEVEEEREKYNILLNLLTVDRFLKVEELVEFFAFDRESLIDFLVEKEIHKQLKIINVANLFVTPYENFQGYLDQLNAIFTDCYTGRIKSLKLSEIEEKLKIPVVSLFFKYLVQRMSQHYSFKVLKDKIVFQKVAMSEVEKGSLEKVEDVLKKNKLFIFTIENILSASDLLHKDVNDSLWFWMESGKVLQLNEKYFMFTEDMNKILNKIKKFKRNQGEMIDIQVFRELTQLSRKYIIIIFEYFDAQKITERVENKRKILLTA